MTKFVIPLLEAITMQASLVILKGDQSVLDPFLRLTRAQRTIDVQAATISLET